MDFKVTWHWQMLWRLAGFVFNVGDCGISNERHASCSYRSAIPCTGLSSKIWRLIHMRDFHDEWSHYTSNSIQVQGFGGMRTSWELRKCRNSSQLGFRAIVTSDRVLKLIPLLTRVAPLTAIQATIAFYDNVSALHLSNHCTQNP